MERERQSDGTFKRGVSGNPNGRPVKRKPDHSIPARNRRELFKIAQMEVAVTINGKTEMMSMYNAANLQLAMAAAKGDRHAAKLFVQTVNSQAQTDLLMRKQAHLTIAHMNAVEEENHRLRERVEQRSGVLVLPKSELPIAGRSERLDDGTPESPS